jgi:hypothetical protein
MRATFSARAFTGSKTNPVKAKWPVCFRLTFADGKIQRERISGLSDYSSRNIDVWYIVDPGVYEVREPDRDAGVTRYMVAEGGNAVAIDAAEVVQCLRRF